MSDTFLTQEEMQELTGYQLPSAQIRWLEREGWVFSVSAMKRPKVLRAYLEAKMGLEQSANNAKAICEPFARWKTLTPDK